MANFLSAKIVNSRSQDLQIYYKPNGAIYICDLNIFLKEKTFFINSEIFAYVMPNIDSIDIDTQLDFDFAHFSITKNKILRSL